MAGPRFASVVAAVVVALACLAAAEDADGNVKLLMKLVTECGRKEDIAICLKMRAFTFLDRLSRLRDPVGVTDYIQFVRDPNAVDQPEATETDLESALPRSLDEKDAKLDELLWDRITSFFRDRTIKLSIPSAAFEGRGDKIGKGGKKGGGMMMMMAMMMAMKFKMFLAKIALIAGKALMIAKISLVISLIMVLKKWANSHHSEVIYEHGGHRRSFAEDALLKYAQDLAYSGQKPAST